MPLKNIAQLRALKAKERRGEISAEQVREFIDTTPRTKSGRLDIPRGRVRKVDQGQVTTSQRRRSTGQALGYGLAGLGLAGAGAGVTGAKWTPPESHAAAAAKINASVDQVRRNASTMGRGKPTATTRALSSPTGRDLGGTFVRASNLARRYPGRSAALALGLKGAGVAAGVKAWHSRGETQGASHEIAAHRVGKRGASGRLMRVVTPRADMARPKIRTDSSTGRTILDYRVGSRVSKLSRQTKHDTGAAMVGGGTVAGGLGVLAGGVPGWKIKERHGALRSVPGGIFGTRIGGHQAALARLRADVEANKGKAGLTQNQEFLRARAKGKIQPEVEVIRHLKYGRRMGRGALVAGGATALGGGVLMRANRRPGQNGVRKSSQTERANAQGAGLLGAGATLGVSSEVLRRTLRGQAGRWRAAESASLAEGRRNLPGTAHRTRAVADNPARDVASDPYRNKLAPSEFRTTGRTTGTASRSAIRRAGEAHGAAAQQRYFAQTYHGAGKVFGHVRTAGAALAALGGGMMLANRQPRARRSGRVRKVALAKKADPQREAGQAVAGGGAAYGAYAGANYAANRWAGTRSEAAMRADPRKRKAWERTKRRHGVNPKLFTRRPIRNTTDPSTGRVTIHYKAGLHPMATGGKVERGVRPVVGERLARRAGQTTRQVLTDWNRPYVVPKKQRNKHWDAAYRDFPAQIPGGRTRRVLARTYGASRLGRFAAPVIGAGATGGALHAIATREGAVRKSDALVRAEMYPHLRPIPDNGYIRLVRLPTDALKQIASARLMDRAVAESYRRRRKGQLPASARYTMGRQYLFSTTAGDER